MTILIALLSAPFILLTLAFAVEVFSGLAPLRDEAPFAKQTATGVVIVPAHDEENGLRRRLSALKAEAGVRVRILVVADNCSDTTAAIARQLDVEVIERFDSGRRGKGFALDFARCHLVADAPDVVVIIDADCITDRQSIEALVDRAAATQSPCQATYLQTPVLTGPPAVQLSTFAFFIKNVIRQRALYRISGRVQLLGSGMAFPWSTFSQADLATGSIVEDLKLGQELAASGHPPIFVEGAAVWSDAETESNTLSQRRRWEGGFLHNASTVAPKLLARSAARGDGPGMWAAIDLMIPPFTLLLLVDIIVLALSSAAASFIGEGAYWIPLVMAAAVGFSIFSLALAWRGGGSRFVSLRGLARAPLYLLWKLPVYTGFARGGFPKEWVRTARDQNWTDDTERKIIKNDE